jgi:hypothetical protein
MRNAERALKHLRSADDHTDNIVCNIANGAEQSRVRAVSADAY